MGKDQPLKQTRKHLSADALFWDLYAGFKKVPDNQPPDASISLADALMSGFALFALKDPRAATRRRQESADDLSHQERPLRHSDTNDPRPGRPRSQFRPEGEMGRPVFRDVFRQLQRGKVLERFTFLEDYYLLSLDGTGYFSSEKVHCDSCMEKTSRNGKTTYYHQMLGAAIVHPDLKEVIPLMPEPPNRFKQDGQAGWPSEKRLRAERGETIFRALSSGPSSFIGGICHVDDPGVFGRPNAAAVLSVVPGSLEKDE